MHGINRSPFSMVKSEETSNFEKRSVGNFSEVVINQHYENHMRSSFSQERKGASFHFPSPLRNNSVAAHIPLRRGKWTEVETAYANAFVKYYEEGLVQLPNGVSLRQYLSTFLHCSPMRITKKFVKVMKGGVASVKNARNSMKSLDESSFLKRRQEAAAHIRELENSVRDFLLLHEGLSLTDSGYSKLRKDPVESNLELSSNNIKTSLLIERENSDEEEARQATLSFLQSLSKKDNEPSFIERSVVSNSSASLQSTDSYYDNRNDSQNFTNHRTMFNEVQKDSFLQRDIKETVSNMANKVPFDYQDMYCISMNEKAPGVNWQAQQQPIQYHHVKEELLQRKNSCSNNPISKKFSGSFSFANDEAAFGPVQKSFAYASNYSSVYPNTDVDHSTTALKITYDNIGTGIYQQKTSALVSNARAFALNDHYNVPY